MRTGQRLLVWIALLGACQLETGRGIPDGAILGRVIGQDAAGRVAPVEGAQVELEGNARKARSGSDGTFMITEVPAGTWTLKVRKKGESGEVGVRVPGVTLVRGPRGAAGVHLSDVRIGGLGRWEGRLLRRGKPLPDGRVVLTNAGEATSGRDGAFVMEGILPGKYAAAVVLPGGEGVARIPHVEVPFAGTVRRVVNLDGITTDRRASARGAVLLRGREKHEGIRIRFGIDGEEAVSSDTSEDGSFRAGPMDAGTWTLRASAPGFQEAELRDVLLAGDTTIDTIVLEPLLTNGGGCSATSQCGTGACTQGTCQTPSCTDGAKNGSESGVDCGGPCEACDVGEPCAATSDCASGSCLQAVCRLPSCSDGVRNGSETAIDCGGSTCSPCPSESACAATTDCASGVCSQGSCAGPTCDDGVRNGTETGTDCGGPCGDCAAGERCGTDGDCGSELCAVGICQARGFEPLVDRDVDTLVASAAVGFSFDGSVAAWVDGDGDPQISTDGGLTWGVVRTIVAGLPVQLRMTTSSELLTTRVARLHLGSAIIPWLVTTRGLDAAPTGLAFTALDNVPVSTPVVSELRQLVGFTEATDLSISGDGSPTLRIDDGPWTTTGRAVPGQYVQLRMIASPRSETLRTATLKAATKSAVWTVRTRLEIEPPPYATFTSVSNAEPASTITSNAATLQGLPGRLLASVSGVSGTPLMRINGGAWSLTGSVVTGDRVELQVISAPKFSTPTAAVLTVGNARLPWTVTTRAIDNTPETFTFTDVDDAEPNAVVSSDVARIRDIDGALDVLLDDGAGTPQVRVNGGAWEPSAPGGAITPIRSGQTLQVRLQAASTKGSKRETTVRVGTGTATFRVTTKAETLDGGSSTGPTTLDIAPVVDAEPGAFTTSALVTISGISAGTLATIEGQGSPRIRLASGDRWDTAAVIGPNTPFLLALNAASDFSATRKATLTLDVPGGATGTFSVTTRAEDTVPAGLKFASKVDEPNGVIVASEAALLTDFDGSLVVTVTGDGNPHVRIDGGEWSETGSVQAGARVEVELTSASIAGTTRTATVTVGTTTASFTVATRANPVPPAPLVFTAATGADPSAIVAAQAITPTLTGGPVLASATGPGDPEVRAGQGDWAHAVVWNEGQTLAVRTRASAAFDTTTQVEVQLGAASGTFDVTTRAMRTTPSGLAFTSLTDQQPGSGLIESNTATLTTFDPTLPVSISGDGTPEFRIDGGPWSAAPATIHAGQTLQLRMARPTTFGVTRTARVTVGATSASWSYGTITRDQEPDTFAFTSSTGRERLTSYDSNMVRISGIEDAVNVSVSCSTACGLRINGGAPVASGTVTAGSTLQVQGLTGAAFDTDYTFSITVGETTVPWTLRTRLKDEAPMGLLFAEVSGVAAGAMATSDSVTPTDYDGPLEATVQDGELSISGGGWTTSASINPGDSLRVRRAASTTRGGTATANVKVGTISAIFTVNTLPYDITPDAFDFVDLYAQTPSRLVTSAPVTITGLEIPATVSVAGDPTAMLSINGAAFTTSGTIFNGETLRLRLIAPASSTGTATLTCTVGTLTADWIVSTTGFDSTPDTFDFADRQGVDPGSLVTSEIVTLTGFTGVLDVRAATGSHPFEVSVDGGGLWATTAELTAGTPLRLRTTTSRLLSAPHDVQFTIGTSQVTWRVTNRGPTAADAITLGPAGAVHSVRTTSDAGALPSFLGTVQFTSIAVEPANALAPELLVGATQTVAALNATIASASEVRLRVTPLVAQTPHAVTATFTGGMTATWRFTTAAPSPASLTGSCLARKCVFDPTGSAQTFIVPANVTSLVIKSWGAGGGQNGGPGGYTEVTANLTTLGITAGNSLEIRTGAGGAVACGRDQTPSAYPGGGRSGTSNLSGSCSGGGGGYSAVFAGETRLLALAAGGGGGADQPGGAGGGITGASGQPTSIGVAPGGGGGSAASGGLGGNSTTYADGADGTALQGGTGALGGVVRGGGGGGGGWFGGGGGSAGAQQGNGGGGGSGRVGTLAGLTGGTFASTIGVYNAADADYAAGIGTGGAASTAGGPGRVVVSW